MKKILSLCLSVVILISMFYVVSFTAIAEEIDKSNSGNKSGDYEYIVLADNTAEIKSYSGKDTSISIPSTLDSYTVTSIGEKAFSYQYDIESVEIPNTVKKIGLMAFYQCEKMKSVIIPDSVEDIGISAFYACESLESVTIPKLVKEIDASTFYGCKMLKQIVFTGDVEAIRNSAFIDCESLQSINIPKSLYYIEAGAFLGCKSLSKITVDKDSEYFTDANSNCIIEKSSNKLILGSKDTIIPNYVARIENYAFYESDISKVSIPASVKAIGLFAFRSCSKLSSVTIEDGVETIYWGAFKDCTSLKSVTIPESVTTIENLAFGFYYDETMGSDTKIEGFTIFGIKGSEAENYAKDNGFKFEEYVPPKPKVKLGDADMNDNVDIMDATCIQKYLVNLIDETKIDKEAADVDSKGLDILDATCIQKFLVHIANIDGTRPYDENYEKNPK